MRSLLARYPDPKTGLSAWDLRLLEHVADVGPMLRRVIGYALADERAGVDMVGDRWCWWRLQRMASAALPRALVALRPSDEPGQEEYDAHVHLTPDGEAVLRGEASFARWNPYYDEIGGVTLDFPSKPLWLYEEGTLVERTWA